MNIPINIMPWACLPASLAMVLDLPFEQVIKELGHSGDERPYADGVTPKGFHMQECIDIALSRGYSVTEIIAYFGSRPSVNSTEQVPTLTLASAVERFNKYVKQCKLGIFSGFARHPDKSISNHACAWDGERIHDPRGLSYAFDEAPLKNFLPQTLWMFSRMESTK
jgi:hypothetical protein